MLDNFRNSRWFVASAFIVASCSQGDASRITSPTGAVTQVSITDGGAGASADGDVKTGPGALEIVRLRMDRQTPGGASIFRQYALPGVTYFMNPGETIELWAEWDPDKKLVPTVIPANPNMTVDWGGGEGSTDTNCGSCKLTHAYPDPGVYKVVVTLNDRNGTRVSRTFYLNSTEPDPDCIAPASSPIPNQGSCVMSPLDVSGSFTGSSLTYSLDEGSCGDGRDVAALGEACEVPEIDATTGEITISSGPCRYCVAVIATNGCGTTSQSLLIVCD